MTPMADDELDFATAKKPPRHAPLSIKITDDNDSESELHPKIPGPPQRQSSFAQHRPDGTPRTPNRVRFDIEDMTLQPQSANALASGEQEWVDEEDYLQGDESSTPMLGQRAPLLTDIEAPSVTVAVEFDPEDHLESARPRSNMRNAFMNMANSIMWAN
jgi:solute carrier family 38 (sodium-coupled neutral amino acid transporter), member 11